MARFVAHGLPCVALALATLFASTARAVDPQKAACIDAHERGQKLRLSGQWHAAKDQLVACAQSACPPPVQRDCVQWIGEIRAAQPSLIVLAKAPNGADTVDVRTSMDGAPLADRLRSTALDIDPGEHVLRFEHRGWTAIERKIVMHEGDTERRLELSFTDEGRGPANVVGGGAVGASHSFTGYVFAGVAILAGGVAAAFDIVGKVDENGLASSCAPRCSDERVDPVRRDYVVAAASLGVGVLAGIAAVWAFATHTDGGPSVRVGPEVGGVRFVF
jgi:hypothetical protein